MIKEVELLKEETVEVTEEQAAEIEEVLEEVKVEQEVLPKDKKTKKGEKPVTVLSSLVKGVVVGASVLRVRKQASTRSDILREVEKGTILHIDLLGSTESFYRIILDPKTSKTEGFVVKDFVSIVAE